MRREYTQLMTTFYFVQLYVYKFIDGLKANNAALLLRPTLRES